MARGTQRQKMAWACWMMAPLLAAPLAVRSGEQAPREQKLSLSELQKQLGAEDFDERQRAREALLERAEQFYLKLAEGLNSEDLEVRRGTAEVLKGFESRIRLARIKVQLNGEERKALDEMKTRDPELLHRITSPKAGERVKACADLVDMEVPVAVPVLAALSRDEDGQVQSRAAKALGELGKIEALPRLKELVEAKDNAAQKNQLSGNRAWVMARMMKGGRSNGFDSRPISQIAIEAIGKLKHADAARFLAGKLEKPVGGTVADYIRALGQTRQPNVAVPALMRHVEDRASLAGLPLPGQAAPRAAGRIRIQRSASVTINGQKINLAAATVGDLAFAAILDLSGQEARDYGLTSPLARALGGGGGVVRFGGGLFKGSTRTFKDEAARKKGLAKLKAWYRNWSARAKKAE